ncbi:MAG TPA: penicillin-binding protein 1A [Verrucomicrobiae bacterium]|nr:penicillin-binding protein 1A [Verrucomicrobiae bacterium]
MRLLGRIASALFLLLLVGTLVIYLILLRISSDLPDYQQLANYEYPVVTRVLAGDGRLLAEYSIEKRVYVPIRAIPRRVIDAFLAAEDKTFYEHPGIDVPGIVNAILINAKNHIGGGDRRPVGASTITQQVAKNFLLTNEVSYERKVKEAILAYRIEQAYSKDRILELYLNQIYLGQGSYGVAAASLDYFNKRLDELTISEAAYIAGLPKAPENYNMFRKPAEAKGRRDWVIGRMLEDGRISKDEAIGAKEEALVSRKRGEAEVVRADYFAEEVRRELIKNPEIGEDGLYKGGLYVRSTLNPKFQDIADRVLRAGLVRYDLRHGYRGPVAKIELGEDWAMKLAAVAPPADLYDWRLAAVLSADDKEARIGFADKSEGTMPLAELKWARFAEGGKVVGKAIAKASDAVQPGDVVIVVLTPANAEGEAYPEDTYALRQIPEVSGALVAMDPHTGRVHALTGGWSYTQSEFNRATQALRQPGSSFKPIVYLAALDSGFTPSTVILDAPITLPQGPGLPLWSPENYGGDFLGPTTMRVGIEKSRNLMTVRVAQAIGMQKVVEYATKLGVVDHMDPVLSMALGAGETTPLRMATAYSMIVNGGKKITATFIDRIQDRRGHTLFRHDDRICDCASQSWADQTAPVIPDTRAQVIDPGTAYQMVSILEGVVQRGTATIVKQVGKPLAGKTGTTNDSKDTWFVGFSPDLTVGVYIGFDNPRNLGDKETGGGLAAPIFRDFMLEALADQPATPFRVPAGIRLVRVDLKSGQRASGPGTIFEAFKPGTEPNGQGVVIGGSGDMFGTGAVGGTTGGGTTTTAPTGTGGLY